MTCAHGGSDLPTDIVMCVFYVYCVVQLDICQCVAITEALYRGIGPPKCVAITEAWTGGGLNFESIVIGLGGGSREADQAGRPGPPSPSIRTEEATSPSTHLEDPRLPPVWKTRPRLPPVRKTLPSLGNSTELGARCCHWAGSISLPPFPPL